MLKQIVIASVFTCVAFSVNVNAHGDGDYQHDARRAGKHVLEQQGKVYADIGKWFDSLPVDEKERLPVVDLIKVMEFKGREVVEWLEFPFQNESVYSLRKMGLKKVSDYATELLREASN